MDIYRRHLAPITESAWEQIEDDARTGLINLLSARKVIDVEGPRGWNFSGIPEGRMKLVEPAKNKGFNYGIRKVIPVVEPRVSFNLNIWELDNATRGAEDIELDNMMKAVEKIAAFEEKAIYNGLKDAGIEGLLPSAENTINLPKEPGKWVASISEAILKMQENSIEGPYSLVLPPAIWKTINYFAECHPILFQIREIIKGDIILSKFIDNGLLISTRGDDFRMTLGSDFSIGYEHHDSKEVTLFLTESFTFQVFEPLAAVKIQVK